MDYLVFEYNDNKYYINKHNTLQELYKDHIQLPLSVWNEIFIKKWGRCYLYQLVDVLKIKIEQYDVSDEVNSFLINGQKFWLDKATRVGLMHLANCSTDNVQLVLGDQVLTIPVDIAKAFLAQLEVYAGQCYLQTQKHLIAIKNLRTKEEIINYDYTTGYPEKIQFNL